MIGTSLRLAALLLASATALAAPSLVVPVAPRAGAVGPKAGVEATAVRFNGEELFAMQPGEVAEFALPTGRVQSYTLERVIDYGGGIRSWVGKSAIPGSEEQAIVTQGPGGAFGWMRTPEAEWRIFPGDGHEWLARRAPMNFAPRFAGGDAIVPPDDPPDLAPFKGIATPMPTLAQQKALMAKAAPTPGFTVDLMVLYTPDIATKLGAGLLPMIYNLVTSANAAYVGSEIALTLRLVNASLVDLPNSVASNDALASMNNGAAGTVNALFQPLTWDASSLRNTLGADIVALVRDGPTDTGGVGFVLGNPKIFLAGVDETPQVIASAAYSINNFCADGCESIFTHELGHNMGNAHDRATVARDNDGVIPNSGRTFPYSYGHYDCLNGLSCDPFVPDGCPSSYAQCVVRQANDFGTVMSYVNPTVMRFSNPNVLCVPAGGVAPGRPCGVAGTADNARSMNETRHNISAYRTGAITNVAVPGSLQFTKATYPGTEAGGTVVFTASRSGGSVGAVSVAWSVSAGTATGGTDFTVAAGTLNWADGDGANKTFTVTVSPDALAEGIESFTATLANAAGATGVYLGHPSVATGLIVEPWPPGGTAPAGFASATTPTVPWSTDGTTFDPAGGDSVSWGSYAFSSVNNPSYTGNSSSRYTGAFAAGTVSFSYRVNSYPNFGFLEFLVDDVVVFSDSGETGWQSFAAAIEAGMHTLEWRFRKPLGFLCRNGNPQPPQGAACADRAWIDTVSLPLAAPVAITVVKAGAGTGTVTSTPAGISCGAACTTTLTPGTFLQLTPTPAAGSAFTGWSGGGGTCTGTGSCFLTVGGATTLTATFDPPSIATPRLANISTRMQVLTGDDVLIGGFVIQGTASKTVVVRARGPSLIPFGIANALVNPVLQLFSGPTQVAINDDWGTAANAAAVTSSGFAPGNALESAILMTLAPGAYTGIVTGAGGATGVGIIEVFEVDQPGVPLANISTRGRVLTGNDVMIGGFVIQGTQPQTVVVRARGPSLIPFGIANALGDPVLQLFTGATPITSNDNWQTATNAAAIQASGFAPSNANESAILITLAPGAYTAIVTGAGNTTGVGIIEVFAQ